MRVLRWARNQWDRAAALALCLAGFATLIVGYFAVSGTLFAFEQIPYIISCGFVGACLVVLGATMWLSADLQDEWRKLDRMDERFQDALAADALRQTRSQVGEARRSS